MKPKPLWGALTRVLENMEPPNVEASAAARYRQHTDAEDAGDEGDEGPARKASVRKDGDKGSREVHFAFLPDRYEPLEEEDEEKERAREEKKMRRKEKYKKYRKVTRDACEQQRLSRF